MRGCVFEVNTEEPEWKLTLFAVFVDTDLGVETLFEKEWNIIKVWLF